MLKKGMMIGVITFGVFFSFITFIRSATMNAHQNIEKSVNSSEMMKR